MMANNKGTIIENPLPKPLMIPLYFGLLAPKD